MQNMQNFMLNMSTMNNQRSQEQAALEAMMKQYGINRDTGLSQIQNTTEDAKQALENRSFQDYLQSRQGIADRGLSGSGIAADADTRLALAKQQNMAGIMRDAATRTSDLEAKYSANMDKAKSDSSLLQNKYGTNLMQLLNNMSNSNMNLQNQAFKLQQDRGNIFSQFAPQFGSVQDKMSQINAAKYEQDMLAQAQQSADKSSVDRMQILSGLLGKMLPYDAMTLNQMGQLGLGYDKLNSGNYNNWQDNMFNYQNNQDNLAFKYAQMQQNGQLDLAKLLGLFQDGTPTLDARKLQQQMEYQNGLLQLRQQGLISDDAYRQAMLQLNTAKFGETQMQNDRSMMNNVISSLDREASTLMAQLKNNPSNAAQIQDRLNQINNQKQYLIQTMGGNYPGVTTGNPVSGAGDFMDILKGMFGGK
jgi:hypothetical protein